MRALNVHTVPLRLLVATAALLSLSGCATYGPIQALSGDWAAELPDFSQKQTVNILLLGDAGKAGPDLTQVADSAFKVCQKQGCDLALVLGDNFYQDGVTSVDDPLWISTFIDPWANMAELDMKFWAIMGNHDWRANLSGAQAQINFTHSNSNPNGLWIMPDLNYQIPRLPTWLDIHLFDSMSEVTLGQNNAYLRALSEENSEGGWLILGAHHFAMSGGFHGKASRIERHDIRLRRALEELEPQLDVLLSGHDHHQELLFNNDYVQVIQGNSSKMRSTYKTRYQKHQKWVRHQKSPEEGEAISVGFTRLSASQDQLEFTYYDQGGSLLHSATIRKEGTKLMIE